MPLEKSDIDELRIDRSARTASPQRRRWIIYGLGAVTALILITFWFNRPRAPLVKVATVAEESGAAGGGSVLNASGYVTARRQATVSSKVTGKVIEVLIEEGDSVSAGQVLARIENLTQSATLRLTQAQVMARQSALEETRVRIAESRLELNRVSRLMNEKISSQSDLDRARAQTQALEARLASQRDELEIARRQVQLQRQDIDDTVIRAPFSGVVVSKNAQPGEMISPMSSGGFTRTGICTLVDMASLEVEVDVNEAYINRVKPAQRVSAILDAYPDWQVPAHVIAVVPTADRQKATVRVRIGFDQRDSRILPDMGVKVSFQSNEQVASKRALVMPRTALRKDAEGDVVFVVKDNKLERRAVVVSSSEGELAKLARGVEAGEKVVISGPADLEDGAKIRIDGESK